MINFTHIKWKNLLSTGNQYNEVQLDKCPTTCVKGINGSGKCVSIHTKVTLKNRQTDEIIETTIGEMYEKERQKHDRENR